MHSKEGKAERIEQAAGIRGWIRLLLPFSDFPIEVCGYLWTCAHHTSGNRSALPGALKSFPVQDDEHLLTVSRYVERNALRANLTSRAEDWRWGSLWQAPAAKPLGDSGRRLAGPPSWALDRVREPAGNRGGARGVPPLGGARNAVRRGSLAAGQRENAGPGIDPARPGPSEEIPRVNGNSNDTVTETTPDPFYVAREFKWRGDRNDSRPLLRAY